MNTNPEVDEWFARTDSPMAEEMRRARQIILAADGRVTESIKWSTPTFAYKGNILSFTPSMTGVGLMFHRGAEIPGDFPSMEGEGRLVRTMRFGSLEELEDARAEIERAVVAWCDWRDA